MVCHDGGLYAPPRRATCVLLAWMLYRSRWQSFIAVPARKRWWDGQLQRLRHEIAALGAGAGTTGVAASDDLIKEWCPEALVPV